MWTPGIWCSVPSAYNTSAGSAEPPTSQSKREDEEGPGGSREAGSQRPPDLNLNRNRGNGKHQPDRNQATGRKLQVGQLDSRTGLGCLTKMIGLAVLMLKYQIQNETRKICKKGPDDGALSNPQYCPPHQGLLREHPTYTMLMFLSPSI